MKHSTIAMVSVTAAVALVAVFVLLARSGPSKTAPQEALASCLTEKGTKFYGAFWCSHCQRQKALFGSAVSRLPYVECSLPDGSGVTEVCRAAGVEGYPTWVFADGSRIAGEATLETLAARAGCPLEGSASSSPSSTTTPKPTATPTTTATSVAPAA